jgi:DNA mismatch endonuclease (patch repair protein)
MVHGCFWHSHSDPNCIDGQRKPKSNLDYWLPKLARNKNRDQENQIKLSELGWKVLVIWECETRSEAALTERLRNFLG